MIPSDAEILELLNRIDSVSAVERHFVLVARGYTQNGDGEKTGDELIEEDGL